MFGVSFFHFFFHYYKPQCTFSYLFYSYFFLRLALYRAKAKKKIVSHQLIKLYTHETLARKKNIFILLKKNEEENCHDGNLKIEKTPPKYNSKLTNWSTGYERGRWIGWFCQVKKLHRYLVCICECVNGGEFYLLYRTQIFFSTIKVNGNSEFRRLFSFASIFYSFDTSRRLVGRRAVGINCCVMCTRTLTNSRVAQCDARTVDVKTRRIKPDKQFLFFLSSWNIWIMSLRWKEFLAFRFFFDFSFWIFQFLFYARFVAAQFIPKMYHYREKKITHIKLKAHRNEMNNIVCGWIQKCRMLLVPGKFSCWTS